MAYIDRASWGARPPKTNPVRLNPANVTHTYIHYGASAATHGLDAGKRTVRAYQNFHMDTREWSDIAYSFLVDQDGNVYEGRGYGIVGGHTKGMNSKSHAICWIGLNEQPSEAALEAINHMIEEIHERLGHTTIVAPHSAAPGASTSCPGDALRQWIKEGRPAGDAPAEPAPAPAPQPAPSALLRLGAKGDAVRHVQERLVAHSVNDARLKVKVDGVFGAGTDKAVRQFQTDCSVPADGVVGEVTLWCLNTVPQVKPAPATDLPVLRRGAKGTVVRHLQDALNKQGAKVKIDGDFGAATEAAVRGFQKRRGLTSDGVVGPATWKALA